MINVNKINGGLRIEYKGNKFEIPSGVQAKESGRFIIILLENRDVAVISKKNIKNKDNTYKIYYAACTFGLTGARVAALKNRELHILDQDLNIIATDKLVQFSEYELQSATERDGITEIVVKGVGIFGRSDIQFIKYCDKKKKFIY